MDLNPLTTPNDVLTDLLNGTVITFNGNEFVLQNDMGNCIVERAKLSPGFVPVGMGEYGGVIYIASLNPETNEGEIGCFPSPERDFSTSDFDNLSPVVFNNTKFTVVTNNTTTKEKTAVIGKLFEPELFQLHPGDMYVVTYNTTTSSVVNDFISKDSTNKKLFRLKFYSISDTNNLSEINSNDIKVIPAASDIEDEYVYFKGDAKATIAVGLEIEELLGFEANVIDRSRKTTTDKKVTIEAIGYSDSLATFDGIRVDVQEPESNTFYITKATANKKVTCDITGLEANSTFACSITPYSKYSLYPKFKKNYRIELGKYISSGTGVNDIFRYYVDPTYLKLDFDFKFEGDNEEGLHLYVEFYDPWSDYSIVKTVDSATFYGNNSVIVQLIDEPTTQVFNASQAGGTPMNQLSVNTDNIYEKTLLNSTSLIRNQTVLRKNHFYIVRISGIDKVIAENGTFTYKHYDFYKGLYTNDMFNEIYDKQGSLKEGDFGYVADFNTLDYIVKDIKYKVDVKNNPITTLTPTITTTGNELTTNGKYYLISKENLTLTPYRQTKLIGNSKSYSINLSLTGTDKLFGDFKQNLVSVETPVLGPGGLQPTIIDVGYDGSVNVLPNSIANWNMIKSSDDVFTINTNTTTERSVYMPVTKITPNTRIYNTIPLSKSVHYFPNGNGPFPTNRKASIYIQKYRVQIARPNGTVYDSGHRSVGIDDEQLIFHINDALGTSKLYSGFVMTSNEPSWFYNYHDEYHSCRTPDAFWKICTLLIRTNNNKYVLTKVHDIDTITDFLDKTYIASNTVGNINVYYPNSSLLQKNGQIDTTVTYPDIDIVTKLKPTNPGLKTYLSTVYIKALNATTDFKASTFNDYIDARKSTSTIVDSKSTLRDGFIPFITTESTSVETVIVPKNIISDAANSAIIDEMIAGSNQYQSDPVFADAPREHGALFTDNPTSYGTVLGKLEVKNVIANVPVTETVYVQNISVVNRNGSFANEGRCNVHLQAPDMDVDFSIVKPY